MATRVKAKVVPTPRRGMSKARRAQLSKLMKAKWEAKRQAAAQATLASPAEQKLSENYSVEFKLGFIKGIVYTINALEA